MSASPPANPAASDPSDPDALRLWRRRVFIATWLSYVGYYFCRKPFGFAQSAIKGELDLDATTLGDIGATYSIAYAVGQFVAGALGPRVGARHYLLAGMGLTILLSLSMGVSDSAASFFLLMALNGLAQASGWSANVATMAAWTHRNERGRIMGWWSTNFQVGSLLSGFVLPYVLATMGWRYAFFTGSLVLLAIWVLFLAWQRNRPEDVGLTSVPEDQEPGVDPAIFRWSGIVLLNILLIGGFYFFMKIIRYAIWSWVPFFLEQNFGLAGDRAGWVSNIFDLAGIPGVIFAGWASDRFFKSRRAGISLILVLLMTAGTGLLWLAGSTSLPVFVLCLAIVGFPLIGPDALMTSAGAMDLANRDAALRVTAVISGLGALGQVLQDVVIGRMYDADGGDLGRILTLLLVSSAGAAGMLVVMVIRGRMGKTVV